MKYLLALGIPAVFALAIFVFETQQFWLLLAVPLWLVGWLTRRQLRRKDPFELAMRERPEFIDTRHVTSRE